MLTVYDVHRKSCLISKNQEKIRFGGNGRILIRSGEIYQIDRFDCYATVIPLRKPLSNLY